MVANSIVDNKKIAQNTLFLYLRMGIMMLTSLFTARIVLNILGATDFGIYNVIGGIVVLFSFLNGALSTATQRYLNYYLGRNELEHTRNIFCMSVNIYLILSLVLFVLAETIGLYFLETQLNIPSDRIQAAHYVYQFVILTFLVDLIRIPYNASIIAYEKMGFYAYVSLSEVILKLIVVYLLYIIPYDKLVVYSFLYTVIPILITIIYIRYCNKKFAITRYSWFWNKQVFKDLCGFSGWSLFGSFANLSAQQGLNFLINIFYGVTVNAAVGIANQVVGTVYQFVSNFQTAFNPQIVKTYASGQFNNFNILICQTSKFSYYLILLFVLPLFLVMDEVLAIWLVDVPEYTAIFCRLILLFFVIDAINAPLWISVQATGKIRGYQMLMAFLILLNLPLAYWALKEGFPVYCVWIVRIGINLITFIARCGYMKLRMNFPLLKFMKETLFPIVLVTLLAMPLPVFCSIIIDGFYLNLIGTIVISFISVIIAIYTWGLKEKEKLFIIDMIRDKMCRH